ncbi:MAG: cobyric acid synthase CobQ, partial [Cyanobacteria bacterium]|nr:cobyric acid synthase CobQ [Cyanobacteriota bacterium]MDW8203282.1 cobyric acid synthase CobQ [Cyanobacteriota bacterium SKYGB_h_bin112]
QPQERRLVRGIVLNNVDRESSALQAGIKWIEDRSGIPVLGAVPYLSQVVLSDDSLTVIEKYGRRVSSVEGITIAVIHLPRISNFTDFEPLEAEASVTVKYLHPRDPLGHPDAVIIPGSKATIADLLVLHKSGMGEALKNYVAAGGTVLGICGGFQMMGKVLHDPEGLEGSEHRYRGLGLLPVKTVISGQKIARQRQVTSIYPEVGLPISGYELYHGRTSLADFDPADQPEQFKCSQLFDEPGLGIVDSNLSVWGTYLHGLFDNGPWRRSWLNRLRQRRGLQSLPTGIANYREQREALLDNLANSVESYLNLSTLLS